MDTPSATWHPAKMPDFSGQNQTLELDSTPNQPAPPVDTQTAEHFMEEDRSDLIEAGAKTQPTTDGAFLDQFNSNHDAEDAAWDLSGPSPASAPQDDDAPIPNHEHNFAQPDPVPTSNASKHSSTISFARTVSHEPSFGDDDDSEWNLQRTETDPFKFMPPNERTNSFPVVPQMDNATEDPVDYPSPSTQAQDIVHDVGNENAHTESVAQIDISADGFLEENQAVDEAAEDESSAQQYLGGDIVGAGETDEETRFEEGLPLIPQNDQNELENHHEPRALDLGDAFAQDAAPEEGDDFFSQITNGGFQLQGANLPDRTLQRKSTSMAMGDIGLAPEASNVDSELSTPIEGPASNISEAADAHTQDTINGDSTTEEKETKKEETDAQPKAVDIDAKWAAAFDDDEDFLLDSTAESKELDPADIFGSDDEGFLDETLEELPAVPATVTSQPNIPAQPLSASLNGRYAPNSLPGSALPSPNPYAPAPVVSQMQPSPHPSYVHPSTAPPPVMGGYGAPPPPPSMPKAQSFADKSKGGYTSPYDLPMEVVKPKKRISMQQLPRANVTTLAPPVAPPRSASMYSQPPPSGGSTTSLSPPSSSHSNQHPQVPNQKSTPQLKSKPGFFEDLPMTSKPRLASRNSSHGSLPSPSQHSPYGQLQSPPPRSPLVSASMPPPPQQPPVGASLVGPERASPYASLQSSSLAKPNTPPVSNARYSPAPPHLPVANGGMPPPAAAASRYSPAPPNSRSSSGGYAVAPPPVLAHQPRTSSPLAHSHFEASRDKAVPGSVNGDGISLNRSSSSQHEPRITRVPSLPPTKEVEEEQSTLRSPPTAPKASTESKYNPMQATQTPPPLASPAYNAISPPKRSASNYVPMTPASIPHKEVNFVPPPRSQTQSPGALYGNRASERQTEPVPRPSSVQGATAPRDVQNAAYQPVVRARGMSQHLNLVPPTDGRELDPLRRWRGAPVITWGVGGVLVTSFPTDVPRYGISQALPMIVRSPGEVKVRHVKDIQPLEERLAKFPGPLKGKSKKKETLAWLTTGIDALESSLPNVSFQQVISHEDKRAIERALLWKVLRVFVEHDGLLEGNPTVEKAVREVISPGLSTDNPEPPSAISTGADLTGVPSTGTGIRADAIDSPAIEQIRHYLLSGDREKAVWAAVDKRLWGHAMLISSKMQNQELYKQVAQEFIKKEVNHPGHGNQPLAALYGVLSGNFEESVDELVPVHARAGLQLISTSAPTSASQDALAGLDKWRETLGMVLSNRSFGDAQALRSLGNLLSGYGRAEAAHICYIFAKNCAIFGGLDDPNANFVLVGADHRRQADQCAKETEALQLSEVYEYGLSLAGGLNVAQSCPHLAAYKLQHAMTLAEYGFRDKALHYCEGIYNAITSQTKKSPYYNSVLESSVDDLMRRLKQAPKEESSSWIPKPRMDQVSTNMWSRFNKFVAGDDDENSGNGAQGDAGAESGPFSRLAPGTPSISRSPSVSNFEPYGNGGLSPPTPATKTASRYAPMTSQASGNPYDPAHNSAPRSSMERTSGEMTRSSYDLPRRGSDMQPMFGGPYTPESNPAPKSNYQPAAPVASQTSSYMPTSQGSDSASQPSGMGISFPGYNPYGAAQFSPVSQPQASPKVEVTPEVSVNETSSTQGYQPASYGYEPPSMTSFQPDTTEPESFSGGYEPPSYQPSSFEPPSYEPGPSEEAGESQTESQPKKKSFLDDDEDDIPGLNAGGKSKAEKDRENEEMVRRVAEEEGE